MQKICRPVYLSRRPGFYLKRMSVLAIQTRGLTRRFGALTAVDHLDLQIEKGTIYGFLGPNGCGKSTTIRMLCGLLTPSEGTIDVLGQTLPQDAEALRLRIGYMTQKFSLYEDLSVLGNLRFLAQLYNLPGAVSRQRITQVLSEYGLDKLRAQLAGSLSGGQKQRLALAAAVLHEPDLLFLDEPTSAVDPENRRHFWEKLFDLCDQGTSILVSTHYMDEAERCHRLAILEAGKLCAEDEPKKLLQPLTGRIVEVEADDMRTVKSRLQKLEQVRSSAQQGIRLRVLLNPGVQDSLEFVKNHLSDLQMHCQLVNPSLEDVFVQVTRGARSGGRQ